jgi:UDP-glucose 4-epimerase
VRAIVTGGAGFIGSHVVDALVARGDEVVVLDNLSTGRRENVDQAARLAEVDLAEAGAVFDDAQPEVCFHLAAQAAGRHGTQVVFSSTGGAIYGECEEPADEDSPRRPLAPYGASKLSAEEYLATYNRLHGTSHVALRYGNVYGPRQDPHGEAGVVAIFFGRLAHGEPLRVFGDGRQTRDYVYVGDVVSATLAAHGHAGVFNVGTGVETSVLELADACARVAGVSVPLDHEAARAGELQRSVLDPTRAKRELGFRAETSLEDGLAATWDFIRTSEGEAGRGAN